MSDLEPLGWDVDDFTTPDEPLDHPETLHTHVAAGSAHQPQRKVLTPDGDADALERVDGHGEYIASENGADVVPLAQWR